MAQLEVIMKGYRINMPRGMVVQSSELDRWVDLRGDPAWSSALEPRGMTEFCRFFSPLFPEILERNWVLRSLSLGFPFSWYEHHRRDPEQIEEIEEIEEILRPIILERGEWMVAKGDFLVRVANHLCGDECTFFGFKASVKSTSYVHDLLDRDELDIQIRAMLWEISDIYFDCDEGVWDLLSSRETLLERFVDHVEGLSYDYWPLSGEDYFHQKVLRSEEDFDDWLTPAERSYRARSTSLLHLRKASGFLHSESPDLHLEPHLRSILRSAVGDLPDESTLESAIIEFEKLGLEHGCRGGFWRALVHAAEPLPDEGLPIRLEERFREAVRALARRYSK